MGKYNNLSKEELIQLLEERDRASAQTQDSAKTSSERLMELSLKVSTLLNNMPIGVEIYDHDGYMVYANIFDLKIFETTWEDIKGCFLFDNPNLTKEQELIIKECKESFAFSVEYDFDKSRYAKLYNPFTQRSTKYLQAKGFPLKDPEFGHLGYLFLFIDNTDLVVNTKLLTDNLAMAKAILLNGHSLLGEYIPEKEAIYIDPRLNDNLSECSLSKYVTDNWMNLSDLRKYSCFREQKDWQNNPLQRVVQGKEDYCSFECNLTVENNTTWIRFNATTDQNTEGNPQKVICFLRDITEAKELEQQLQITREESHRAEIEMQKAQEADKLKSAFLANMSHEIRTPLNAIVGFTSLFLETDDREEKEMYLDIITKNNDLLLRLISDILDFSKIETGILDYHLEVVSLRDIIIEQYNTYRHKTQEGVKLVCDTNSLPDIMVYTDTNRVSQILSNLLTNALKFTSQGSVTLSFRKDKDQLVVEVTDTGIGIPLEDQEKIFERFVKVDSFQQGAGLGLAICKTIVEALQGKIGVRSTYGTGSCFWFSLPCDEKHAPAFTTTSLILETTTS